MKAVLFNGSPRKEGNTTYMLGHLARRLEESGAETELVRVGGKSIRGCQACMKCKDRLDSRCSISRDMLNDCLEKMVAADAIVIGSPVYFSSMTAETKALIDRAGYVALANGRLLSRKIGAAVAVARRAGRMTTFNGINHFFLINDMIVPGSHYWNVGVARDPGEMEQDEEGLATMDRLAENITWLHGKIAEMTDLSEALDLDGIRADLEKRLAELGSLREAGAEAAKPVTLDQSMVGRLSRMDAMQGQQMAAETARRRAAEANKIKAALARLDRDEYGYCLRCEEDIDTKRLQFDPAATLCIRCARA